LVFAFVYFLRFQATKPPELFEGAYVRVQGMVSNQPNHIYANQVLVVHGLTVKTVAKPEYYYADSIEVIGKLEKQVTEGQKESFVLIDPQIRLLAADGDEGNGLKEQKNYKSGWDSLVGWVLRKSSRGQKGLWNLRESAVNGYQRLLPEPQAGLVAGIVLGAKQGLTAEFTQDLRSTGTAHIVVASGYNIAVIAGACVGLLVLVVKRKTAIWLTLAVIVVYTVFAGGEAAIVRAAIMGSVGLLAQLIGREKEAGRALFLAAGVMLLVSPQVVFDLGFQLSFAATTGIMYLSPILSRSMSKWPLVGENLAVTLAAQLTTWPIIVSSFGSISGLSLVVNLLVLPVIPLVMLLGAVLLGISFVPVLNNFVAGLVWVPLTYFVEVVRWFGKVNWAVIKVDELQSWYIWGYYMVLLLIIVRHRVRNNKLINN